MKILDEYRETIDREIRNFIGEKSGFYTVIRNYIENGGKRLRPFACMLAYESMKGKSQKILLPAVSLELFHTATLCHDDIMDEDSLRRNKASCHKSFQELFLNEFREKEYKGDIFSKLSTRHSVSKAIIAGNILICLGYKAITESDFPDELKNKAVERVSEIIRTVNEGQILDIEFENKKADEKDYIGMISKKTASLLGMSFELGAIMAGKNESLFYDFGFNLGIAFQIIDDLMDIDEEKKKGNTFGSDLRKGKKTILSIKSELPEIKSEEGIRNAVKTIKEKGVTDYAENLAEEYVGKAREILDKLELGSEYHKLLSDFADYITRRKS